MNLRDTYLHNGTRLVKDITFGVAASGDLQGKVVATITWTDYDEHQTSQEIPISFASFGAQAPHSIYAGPGSGSNNAVPSFRSLVAADIPDLPGSKITSGTVEASYLPAADTSTAGIVPATSTAIKFLKSKADGTLEWGDETTYSFAKLAFQSTAGTNLVTFTTLNKNLTIVKGDYISFSLTDRVLTISSQDTWVANDKDNAGYVAVPKNGSTYLANKVWKTDSSGNPGWRDDANTWKAANTSQEGYVPKLTTGESILSASSTDYVLAYVSGTNGVTTPTWVKLPANAYKDTWTAFVGASASSNGTAGYISAPGKNNQGLFFRGDGQWATPTNTWRPIYTGGTSRLNDASGGKAINFAAGSNVSISYLEPGTNTGQSGNSDYAGIKINATDTTYVLKVGTASDASDVVTVLNGKTTTTGVIITNSAYNATNNKIATMSDVSAAVGSVFVLKGDTATLPTDNQTVGWAYRASAAFTLAAANSVTGSNQSIEIGDLLVCTNATGPKFLVVNTNWSVSNSASTLGTSATTIATIGGINITASLPIAARGESSVTSGVITPTDSGTTKFLREDGTWVKPSYTTDTNRPIYVSGGNAKYNSSTKTGINFIGNGATSVTFIEAGTETGQSGSANYGTIKISSANDLVKFAGTAANTDYYLAVKAANDTTTAQQLYYKSGVKLNGTTITASLSGNATTASNLSKTDVRGYLYQSANATTTATGVGSVNATNKIGIPYIGYTNSANTYALGEDFFYKASSTFYIGDSVHSIKFATIKTKNSTTDDWDGSTTSGTSTGSGTTYTAGDGISINNGTISTTLKEWYGTEAQFNALTSLDNNTTYYITAT